MAAHMERFKLLVVGDCGVGKSSFVCGVVHQTPLQNAPSTIGCNVEVLPYSYDDNGRQRDVFLEFWDVGGSSGHRNSRSIFYNNIDGLIVVHDLSNRKSFLNLQKWVGETFNSNRQEFTGITVSGSDGSQYNDDECDAISHGGGRKSTTNIPVLVLGTKEDQCNNAGEQKRNAHHIGLSNDSDVIFCSMNCLQEGQLQKNSNKWQSLHAFFHKVIDVRLNGATRRNTNLESNSEFRGRKKIY
ncbi:rab-like protein 3 [Clytia hemisphaerica]|uniref:Uncharacterized protein n=1 Tax=Clytia hemisphaerica TaxID=252671 RepID=A0A7M5TT96_9CNID